MTKDRVVGGDRLQERVVGSASVSRLQDGLIEIIANREGLRGVHGEWVQKDLEETDQGDVDGPR